jgi:hypothetical protein
MDIGIHYLNLRTDWLSVSLSVCLSYWQLHDKGLSEKFIVAQVM